MRDIDILRLDGQTIRTFLIILEESSVSQAAFRLELTQSAVSHTLAKLRRTLGDPLFVRSGQGLTPTEAALSLKGPAQDILDRMTALTERRVFDPKAEALHFRVAANDMQRDLLFPDLVRASLRDSIDLSLEIIPSGVPSLGLLRDARCDLLLTPLPPDGTDLIQRKLFSGTMKCFYDGRVRDAPQTLQDYVSSQHIDVEFALGGKSSDVLNAPKLPSFPVPRVKVSNFSGIQPFLRGTSLLTTQLEHLHQTALQELDMADLPFRSESVGIYMVWHQRSTNDPAHGWLREQIQTNAINSTSGVAS